MRLMICLMLFLFISHGVDCMHNTPDSSSMLRGFNVNAQEQRDRHLAETALASYQYVDVNSGIQLITDAVVLYFRCCDDLGQDFSGCHKAFITITEDDADTTKQVQVSQYMEDCLTNGNNDNVQIGKHYPETTAGPVRLFTESQMFTGQPGYGAGPDLIGNEITSMRFQIHSISIRHPGDGWTFTSHNMTLHVMGEPVNMIGETMEELELILEQVFQGVPGYNGIMKKFRNAVRFIESEDYSAGIDKLLALDNQVQGKAHKHIFVDSAEEIDILILKLIALLQEQIHV